MNIAAAIIAMTTLVGAGTAADLAPIRPQFTQPATNQNYPTEPTSPIDSFTGEQYGISTGTKDIGVDPLAQDMESSPTTREDEPAPDTDADSKKPVKPIKIGDIKGESVDDGHKDWISLL